MGVPAVGSLAAPAPAYREAMQTGEGAAILLGLRRSSGHLYYPSSERGFWVSTRHISSIPAEVLPDDCLERLLSDLLLALGAEECELSATGDRALRLSIEVPELGRELWQSVERRWSRWIKDYAFEAGSMRAMIVRLDLADLPEAAGAGN